MPPLNAALAEPHPCICASALLCLISLRAVRVQTEGVRARVCVRSLNSPTSCNTDMSDMPQIHLNRVIKVCVPLSRREILGFDSRTGGNQKKALRGNLYVNVYMCTSGRFV